MANLNLREYSLRERKQKNKKRCDSMMRTDRLEVPIRELVEGYRDDADKGVVGYGGRLDIRPSYQREFIYNAKNRGLVIDTIKRNLPLGLFHWGYRVDGDYEIIDGQQRTISICQYVNGDFSHDGKYFHNLTQDERDMILDYTISVSLFNGNESEKLEWFERINVAGEVLTKQELRNAVYHGTWLQDAKKYFSRTGCPAYQIGGDYLKGTPIRQDYLETVIRWSGDGDIEEFMAYHQHDTDAKALWRYFEDVMDWVKSVFITYRPEMKGLPWGLWYNEYANVKSFDPIAVDKRISELYADVELKNNKGIYQYILTGNSKYLNLRTFDPHIKKAVYEQQGGVCKYCGNAYKIGDMHADHIMPWSLGGQTTIDNCQILCKDCNARKSGNY